MKTVSTAAPTSDAKKVNPDDAAVGAGLLLTTLLLAVLTVCIGVLAIVTASGVLSFFLAVSLGAVGMATLILGVICLVAIHSS